MDGRERGTIYSTAQHSTVQYDWMAYAWFTNGMEQTPEQAFPHSLIPTFPPSLPPRFSFPLGATFHVPTVGRGLPSTAFPLIDNLYA